MEVVELEVDPEPADTPAPVASAPREEPVSGRADTAPAFSSPDSSSSADPNTQVPAPLESRSRLVVAATAIVDGGEALEPADEGAFDQAASDPTIEAAAADVSAEALEDEEAPSSSRRPISLEAKMSEPDDDAAPLHSAPRESGRIPAALPNLELADVTPSSVENAPIGAHAEKPPAVSPLESSGAHADSTPALSPFESIGGRAGSTPALSPFESIGGRAGSTPALSPVESEEPEGSGVNVHPLEPPARTEVAQFVTTPRPRATPKTFGELVDEALSI